MKNLNYKAWHKEEKRMYEVLEISLEGKSITSKLPWASNVFGNPYIPIKFGFDEVILMQSTGLKDSKGVEIFEGDIISDAQGVSTLGKKCDETGAQGYLHASEVKADHCGVHTFDDIGNYIQLGVEGQDVFEVEVIGNIYHNSELLEEK